MGYELFTYIALEDMHFFLLVNIHLTIYMICYTVLPGVIVHIIAVICINRFCQLNKMNMFVLTDRISKQSV